MGMVPIPVISPLTLARSEEPVLEPTLPIVRVENSAGEAGGGAEESYSPGEQEPAPDAVPADAEASATATDSCPTRHISYFA